MVQVKHWPCLPRNSFTSPHKPSQNWRWWTQLLAVYGIAVQGCRHLHAFIARCTRHMNWFYQFWVSSSSLMTGSDMELLNNRLSLSLSELSFSVFLVAQSFLFFLHHLMIIMSSNAHHYTQSTLSSCYILQCHHPMSGLMTDIRRVVILVTDSFQFLSYFFNFLFPLLSNWRENRLGLWRSEWIFGITVDGRGREAEEKRGGGCW